MLQIPSESLIEAVFSEVESHAEIGRDRDDDNITDPELHRQECEFCQILREMEKRNQEAPADKLCALDTIVYRIHCGNPFMQMITIGMGIGSPVVETLVTIGRMCFLLGMKAERAQSDLKKFEENFPQE